MTNEEFLGIESAEDTTRKLPPTRMFEVLRYAYESVDNKPESVVVEAHSWAIESNGSAVFYRYVLMPNEAGRPVPISQTVRAIRQWEEVRELVEFNGAISNNTPKSAAN